MTADRRQRLKPGAVRGDRVAEYVRREPFERAIRLKAERVDVMRPDLGRARRQGANSKFGKSCAAEIIPAKRQVIMINRYVRALFIKSF